MEAVICTRACSASTAPVPRRSLAAPKAPSAGRAASCVRDVVCPITTSGATSQCTQPESSVKPASCADDHHRHRLCHQRICDFETSRRQRQTARCGGGNHFQAECVRRRSPPGCGGSRALMARLRLGRPETGAPGRPSSPVPLPGTTDTRVSSRRALDQLVDQTGLAPPVAAQCRARARAQSAGSASPDAVGTGRAHRDHAGPSSRSRSMGRLPIRCATATALHLIGEQVVQQALRRRSV